MSHPIAALSAARYVLDLGEDGPWKPRRQDHRPPHPADITASDRQSEQQSSDASRGGHRSFLRLRHA